MIAYVMIAIAITYALSIVLRESRFRERSAMPARRRDKSGGSAGRKMAARSAWPAFLTAHAVLVALIEERLRAAGLPELTWYDVLWTLERAPHRRRRMYEVAELTVVARSNLTRLVDRLEAAGLVERDRDCADRRGAFAVLTDEGLAMRKRMWSIYGPAIKDLFESHLNPAETELMRGVLMRMLNAARQGNG
jgi:DNA-binding MarR family transcriptional regulator